MPKWFVASNAIFRGLVMPAASLPKKSGPPVAVLFRMEVQQLVPLRGSPDGTPFGSQGPVRIACAGGLAGFPKTPLSGFLMRGDAPASSIGLPAWKSKSNAHDVSGLTRGDGPTNGTIVSVSPMKAEPPLERGVPALVFVTVRMEDEGTLNGVHVSGMAKAELPVGKYW
jgi:hypothetical protein